MKQIIILLLTFNTISAQFDVPLSLRAQYNGSYGYTIIGNTHNDFDNWQFPVPPCQMLTQSSATLNLLPSQNIVAAYLYWSGIGDGSLTTNIQLNGTIYNPSETLVGYPEAGLTFFSYFAKYVDVTNQVIASGNGLYNFSNLDLNQSIPAYCSNAIYYSGWFMVIIYDQNSLPNQQINVYDGFNAVSTYLNNGVTPLTINNLNVIDNQSASISYVAWNGSPNLFFNENITFNGNILSNTLNPPDNPFNGTNSFTGSTTNWNQDIDTFDVSPFISIGDTEANIIFNSVFYRLIQTIVTSIRSELPDATVALTQVTGQNVCNNRDLQVNYTVQNTNSNGNLPANIPVSFYANNTLLQTINTPSSIAIGGTLALQTTVTIPANVPDAFNLRVVVDNTTANASTIAESNENNNEASQSITLIGATIASVFSLPNTFCQGAIVPTLPIISNNGISGSWSPNVINNQTNGTYIFTPNAGFCATSFALNVAITNVVPTFSLPNSFCINATVPVLPLTSANGVVGSWSPSVINNQNNGSYVFTPNAIQPNAAVACAVPFTLNVVIKPNTSATFSLPTTFCQGESVPVLPLISSNGVVGSWSPSVINNQTNGSYVFTPNAQQPNPANECALPFTLNSILTPKIIPTFTQVPAICSGETLVSLPTTSSNGITGNWSPTLNNVQTTTYTFTPNAGQCAAVAQMTITVNPSVVSNFVDLTICKNSTPFSLPNRAPNGVLGSWLPTNVDVTATATYTFTPIVSLCTKPQTITINVDQSSLTDFDYVVSAPFTSNATITVSAIAPSGTYLYQLDSGVPQPETVFQNVTSGLHSVTVFDENGCSNSITKTGIFVLKYPLFFTPNGDGYNDTWNINDLFLQPSAKILIFDRFGKLLQQISPRSSGWDGTYNGNLMPADTYWFSVDYPYNNNKQQFRSFFALKR